MYKIDNEFVPYVESLELKKIGFNEPCFAYFNTTNNNSICFVDLFGFIKEKEDEDYHVNSLEKKVSAPTFTQAFRWLYHVLGVEDCKIPLNHESQMLLLKELIETVKSK